VPIKTISSDFTNLMRIRNRSLLLPDSRWQPLAAAGARMKVNSAPI
jgi:hypothetical protein